MAHNGVSFGFIEGIRSADAFSLKFPSPNSLSRFTHFTNDDPFKAEISKPFNMQCVLRFLRSLLPKCFQSNKNRDVALLQLPVEILLLIADNLDLHDKFHISQTCQALRQITLRDWKTELLQLSFDDKLTFWTGVAYTLPRHWVCPKCCKLHLGKMSDTPIIRKHCLPCGVKQCKKRVHKGYKIQHHHIQLALKLSRLGNKYRYYLAALMKTYYTGQSSTFPNSTEYTAEPRIINGRFILREQWILRTNARAAWSLFQHDDFAVCPHLCIRGGLEVSRTWKYAVGRIGQLVKTSAKFQEITVLEDAIELA